VAVGDVWGNTWLATWGTSWASAAEVTEEVATPEAAGGGSVEHKRVINKISSGLFDGFEPEPEDVAEIATKSGVDTAKAIQPISDALSQFDGQKARKEALNERAKVRAEKKRLEAQAEADRVKLLAFLEKQEAERLEAARLEDEETVQLLLMAAKKRRLAVAMLIQTRART